MKNSPALLILAACCLTPYCRSQNIDSKIRPKPGAWDTLKLGNTALTPNDARNFGFALPIGNDRLGGKVFGAPAAETIPLNDTTLWSGADPEHFESPAHHEALLATRAALEVHDSVKADQLVRGMEGPNTQFYEPLADLHLTFPGHETYTDYSNTLDLDSATVTTRYTVNDATFTREMFASYPAQVIVLRLTADRPGGSLSPWASPHSSTTVRPRLPAARSSSPAAPRFTSPGRRKRVGRVGPGQRNLTGGHSSRGVHTSR